MTADWPDDNPSAHRALAIFSQTVPLGIKNSLVANNTYAIASGLTQSAGPFSLQQIGWELAISLNAISSNGSPFRIKLTWSDSGTGLVTDIDSVFIYPGTAALPHVCRFTGRTKGDTVNILFDNTQTAVTANITWALLQNSRVYGREEGKTLSWTAPPGISPPSFDVTAGQVCVSAPTIAGSGSQQRFLPLYIGDVWLHADTASLTSDFELFVTDNITNGLPILHEFTNAKGTIDLYMTLPNGQASITMINNNAAAQLCKVEMVASKRP